jgi:hypothetical protein
MPIIVFTIILEITGIVVGTIAALRPLRMIAVAFFDFFGFFLLFGNAGTSTLALIIFVYLAYLGLEFRPVRKFYPLILVSVAIFLTSCVIAKQKLPEHNGNGADIPEAIVALNQLDTEITDDRFNPKNAIYRTVLVSSTYNLTMGSGDNIPVLSTPVYTNPRYAKEQHIVMRSARFLTTESKLKTVQDVMLVFADSIRLYILEWPIVFFGLLFFSILLIVIRYWKGREDRAYAKWKNERIEESRNSSFDAMVLSDRIPDYLKKKLEIPKDIEQYDILKNHYCQEKKFQKLTNEELIEAEDLGLCVLDSHGEVRHPDRTVNHHYFDHIKDEEEAEKKYRDLCAIYGTYGTAPNATSMSRLNFEYDRYQKKHKGSPKKNSD